MGFLVLAMLGSIPAVLAAPFYLEMTGTVAAPVPIDDLGFRTGEGSNSPGGPCSGNYFRGDPAKKNFRFAEGSDSNGCLGVVHALTVPDGVRRVTVSFLADRVMADSTRGLNLGPIAFEQEVRLRREAEVVAASPYFSPQQGDQASKPFALGFDVPAGSRDLEVEWWFANRGDAPATGDPSSGRLQGWSSTVLEPVVLMEGIRLPSPTLRESGGDVQGGSYVTGHAAEIRVPPEHQEAAAAGRFALHLRMPTSALVDRLLAPDGSDLADAEYETAIEGSSRLVTVPSSTLARLGPGPYTIRFQASEALEVEPTMAVLTVLTFLMPPVALGLAAFQLRRRALDTYLEAADALEGELGIR